jgi:outer membrane receptor protein involved in Fe transport
MKHPQLPLQTSLQTFFHGLSFAVWLALCLTVTAAIPDGSLTGTVKDSSGAAIAGATVVARNTASGAEQTVAANAEGRYEFKDLAPGPYRITVSQPGFSDQGVNLSIENGNATQDFALSAGSLQEEVTVTAARGLRAAAEIPQAVTTVSLSEIEQRRPVSVADAYDRTPSVNATDPNPMRTRPTIRGFQSSRLLITVDGERLNNSRFSADFVGVSPSLVDPTQIQTIEVVAGAGSSLFGSDAIGGTVNIITKGPSRSVDGNRLDGRFDGDFGSNSRFRRGGLAAGYNTDWYGLRMNYASFINSDYRMGNEAITRAEVIKFGQFAAAAGTAAGQTGAGLIAAYPVYDLPANARIGNSGARGKLGGFDFALFPSARQTLRMKYNLNRYGDLGVPYTNFPQSTNRPNTHVSDLDKFSARYELREVAGWLPRISASLFWQDYKRSLNEIRQSILADNPAAGINSSYVSGPPPTFTQVFTGKPSTGAVIARSDTINKNETTGFDIQFNLIPWRNALYITGVNHSLDRSRDNFGEQRFNPANGAVVSTLVGARNTPFTDFKNYGWYNQLEYSVKYLRLAGGFRIDNWKTEAKPTPGFPVGTVAAIALGVLPAARANPQSLNVAGLEGIAQLATGRGSLNTNNTVGTFNIGATVLIKGVNPYIRYATSYREPDTTSRYLIRNFSTSPIFSLPSLINTALKPERGNNIDVGVKLSKQRVRGSFGYYHNNLDDATGTALGGYCIAPNPLAGVLPTPPGFGCPPNTHFSQVFQTVNFSRIITEGVEGIFEADISMGNAGSLTPYFAFSTLRARNQNPDATRLAVIKAVYNGSAPLELDGSATDVPFYSQPNWQGAFAPRFTSRKGNWWAEYEYRWTSRITRVDPNEISFAGTTQYAFFASYGGIQKHSIRGGFSLAQDKQFPVKVTLGVENLTDRLYFLPFQPAPAAGRSFTVGTTIGFNKLW